MCEAKPCCLTRPIASIAYKDARPLRKPPDEAGEQLPREMRRALMAPPMGLTPCRRAVQRHQDRKRPRACRPGQCDEDRDHHPCMAPAISGVVVSGPYAITMPAFTKDLGPGCSATVSSPVRHTGPVGIPWVRRNAISARAHRQADHGCCEKTR
jgi:hypothetical protein